VRAQDLSKNETLVAWFGALCFFLSTIEYMIPKPLPFLRLGLANIPIMLSIELLPPIPFMALVFVKILGQGLVGGTLLSYIAVFSAAGSIASALAMRGLKKTLRGRVSWIGVSVVGAFTSNAVQLLLARLWIFGESAWFIAPPFFAVGLASGALLGAFANRFASQSKWYAAARAGEISLPEAQMQESGRKGGITRFILGFGLLTTILFFDEISLRAAILAIAAGLCLFDRLRIRMVPALITMASVILFNAFLPYGKVLFAPFGFPITEGALSAGVKKALALEGMVLISRWTLRRGVILPGKPGKLVSSAFGIFGFLASGKGRFDPKRPIESLDAIMRPRD